MLIVMNHLDDCCELGWDYLKVSWILTQKFISALIVITPTQGLTSSLNSLRCPSTALDFIVLYLQIYRPRWYKWSNVVHQQLTILKFMHVCRFCRCIIFGVLLFLCLHVSRVYRLKLP